MARISWPSGSPDSPFRKSIGSPSMSPKDSCVRVVADADQRPQLLDVAALRRLDDQVVHAPHRLRQPVEIVHDLRQRRVRSTAGRAIVAGTVCRSRARRVGRRIGRRGRGRSGPASAPPHAGGASSRGVAGRRQFLALDLAQRQRGGPRRRRQATAGAATASGKQPWPAAGARHCGDCRAFSVIVCLRRSQLSLPTIAPRMKSRSPGRCQCRG